MIKPEHFTLQYDEREKRLYIRSTVTQSTCVVFDCTNTTVERALKDAEEGYDSPSLNRAFGIGDSETL